MKKFKFIFVMCTVLTLSVCLLTGCANNEVKDDNQNEKQEEKQEEKTVAKTLGIQFEDEIKNEKNIEKVAKKLAENEILEISVDVSKIKKGDYISGFQKEIKDFKNAYAIRPMIGTIPFVAYIFEVENANEFAEDLKSNADLRWNICTEADEMNAVVNGDYVFFVMSPKNFDQEQ